MVESVVSLCKAVLPLENMELSDGYYYSSLPLCILDAVFSIGVKYTSTENTVKRYCQFYHLPRLREKTSAYPSKESQHTVNQLILNIEAHGIGHFTEQILNKRQRTSSKSGILKSEAVYKWATILSMNGIEYLQDVQMLNEDIENEIRKISGQHSGISLSYFHMLSGNDDLCKPDRHILRFLSEALQRNVIDISEAQKILQNATAQLKTSYPGISVRLLDYTIWYYMTTRK